MTLARRLAAAVLLSALTVPGLAPGAYALATLTGLSRIYNNLHWASDVFVGGELGYFTAKAVVWRFD